MTDRPDPGNAGVGIDSSRAQSTICSTASKPYTPTDKPSWIGRFFY